MAETLGQTQPNRAAHMAICVAGIMCSLVLYSALQASSLCRLVPSPGLASASLADVVSAQERIMTIPYGQEKEVFRVSLFVVLCNRLTSCLLAVAILLVSACWTPGPYT